MAESQEKKFPFTPSQLAAARQLLNRMRQEDLARAAGVSKRTIIEFEAGRTIPHPDTLQKILRAVSDRGIIFTNGDRPGVTFDPGRAIIPT